MHISGKIFAGLVVALGLGSVYMSARTMSVRQAWMDQAQKNEQAFKDAESKLADIRVQRDRRRDEYIRAIAGWERTFDGPNVKVAVDQNGLVLIEGVGASNGVKAGDVVYVFLMQNAEGPSSYLGAVQIVESADVRSSGRPYTRVRPGEIGPTQQPMPARVRKLVPPRYQSEIASIDQRLLLLEQSIANAQDDATFLKDLQDRVELLIGDRLNEINGNPKLSDSNVPEVNKGGLLATIASEEELRNAALAQSDDLLRRLLRTRQKLDEVLAENSKLEDRLPQADPARTTADRR